MRAVRHTRAPGGEALAPGMILAHDVRDAAGRIVLAKGEVLAAGSISQLQSLDWNELHLLIPGVTDILEGEAGSRLAAAAAG
ncbi:MAG: hypothetical protein ACLGIK_16400, partial [Gemmatimonadota bacterium]